MRARLEGDPSIYRFPVEWAEVFAIGDFLSSDECAQLIGIIDAVARPSETLADTLDRSQYRTSYSGDVDPSNSFIKMIERRLGDVIGLDLSWGETIQGQRYMPGQEFRKHCDWFNVEATYWTLEHSRGGQRSWTAMIYLNDVEAGGGTRFPLLKLDVEPRAGALLIWNNATPEGCPNLAVLHAALPVERGVKYVATKWFRTRKWG